MPTVWQSLFQSAREVLRGVRVREVSENEEVLWLAEEEAVNRAEVA